MRRALLLALLLCLAPAAPAAAARPNVVVIETDDQTAADIASMPETSRLIGDEGVTFSNSFVSLSQCCPSRATFLTGQYAHNHGVLTTQPPFGGFQAFHDEETLAVWLHRSGYATSLIGKYMNQYGKLDATYVPPGWSDWFGLLGPSAYSFRTFDANDNGHPVHFEQQYKTDVLTARSEQFLRRAKPPFFMWTTYVAPHEGVPPDLLVPRRFLTTSPSPLFENAFLGPMPTTPAFDEADVSDKPAGIRNRPRFGPLETRYLAESWRRRQQSLLSVDQGVRRIVRALEQAHALDDTLLVFTSDNGYLIGEHRVRESKVLPYEPSIRVPLMMRGPGIPRGATRSQLVWNGDLAPTILQATGATAGASIDGMSLLGFARDPGERSDRAILLEGPPTGSVDRSPRFTGLRTPGYLYVRYLDGWVELYDLRRDPYELHNLAGTPAVAGLQRELAQRLARLRNCSGAACREG